MGLKAFFFRKEPVEGIALFRVLFSCVLLLNAILIWPNLMDFYGPLGMMEPVSPVRLNTLNLFYFMPLTPDTVRGVFLLYALTSLSLLLGLFTRLSAFLCYLALMSLHQTNHLILHSGDTAMRIILFFVALSRAGEAFSLDRWLLLRKGKAPLRPRLRSPWAQRMIQIQVAFLYFSTTFLKVDGESWANGNAVYFTSRLWDFERFPVPFLFEQLWTMKLMTWFSLFVEGALGTLIWFRPLRVPLVVLGILFHLLIEFTMNIPVFEWIMMCLLVSMLEPREARAFCAKVGARLANWKSRLRQVPEV
jgi:hypothetical protein